MGEGFTIVGLPDASVKESKERVQATLYSQGCPLIGKRNSIANWAIKDWSFIRPADWIAIGILKSLGLDRREHSEFYWLYRSTFSRWFDSTFWGKAGRCISCKKDWLYPNESLSLGSASYYFTCSPRQIQSYQNQNRVSGPIRDRFDIYLYCKK